MSRLRLSGLSKRYGDFLAVDGIDLELQSGEFVSLLGPSGCGKTTTLRMIAGFIDPTLGTIEMDGQVLSSPAGSVPPDRRQMSMIFQSYAIWPNMTVEQNVAFGLELRKIAERRGKTPGRRNAGSRPYEPPGRPVSRRTQRRPATAGGAGPRDRYPALRSPARRAACPIWTRHCGRRCVLKSGACMTNFASPPFTSRTTRPKPW